MDGNGTFLRNCQGIKNRNSSLKTHSGGSLPPADNDLRFWRSSPYLKGYYSGLIMSLLSSLLWRCTSGNGANGKKNKSRVEIYSWDNSECRDPGAGRSWFMKNCPAGTPPPPPLPRLRRRKAREQRGMFNPFFVLQIRESLNKSFGLVPKFRIIAHPPAMALPVRGKKCQNFPVELFWTNKKIFENLIYSSLAGEGGWKWVAKVFAPGRARENWLLKLRL